jgi:hypothetical protein
MEHLFAPTRRYQKLFGLDTGWDDDVPFEYTELKLVVQLSDFHTTWNWEDLRALMVAGGVMRTMVWITKDVFLVVVLDDGDGFALDDDSISSLLEAEFDETSGQSQMLTLASIAHADIPVSTREVGVFWRAITTSNCVKLNVTTYGLLGQPSVRVPPQFLRGNASLQDLLFRGFHFKKEHCRALMAIQRTDLDLKLCECTLDPQDDTFMEWFRHNQIVTWLVRCQLERGIISALSGNKSVKKLVIQTCPSDLGKEEMRSLLQALPGNMGIEDLTLYDFAVSEEPWSHLFRSLSTHPRIKFLHILHNHYRSMTYSAGVKSTAMKEILQMLHLNTVVQKIRLPHALNDEAVYQNAILPRLEMNRTCFEAQRQAVKQADDSFHPQLLGRALHVVQNNSDLVFRFLSENVPAFV